jgi:hypothetical protein
MKTGLQYVGRVYHNKVLNEDFDYLLDVIHRLPVKR